MRLCNHKSGELSCYNDYGTGWTRQELWFDLEQAGDFFSYSKAFREDVGLTQPPVEGGWVTISQGGGAGNMSDA
jgi:hypothetical protein